MLHILGEYSLLPQTHLLPQMPPPNLHLFLLCSTAAAAWIATMTVSIWRTRAVGPKPNIDNKHAACSTLYFDSAPQTIQSLPSSPKKPVGRTVATCHVEDGTLGSPRSKFTMSYSCDDVGDYVEKRDQSLDDKISILPCFSSSSSSTRDSVLVDGSRVGREVMDWEAMEIRYRWKGDLGWYLYQDRRVVIDGNVVRLWGSEGKVRGL